jgi:hypothetical protein
LLLLAGSSQAQWGLRAGLNASLPQVKATPRSIEASAEGRLGYQVGVFYARPLSPRLTLVPELQLSQQKLDLKVDDYRFMDAGYHGRYELRLLYVQVPVLLRVNAGRFYAEAGPQAAVLQIAREQGTEGWVTIAGFRRSAVDRFATDRYQRLDVGLCAGLGMRLPSGLGLNLRAYQSLRSLTLEKEQYHLGTQLINRNVQVGLSYQLGYKS